MKAADLNISAARTWFSALSEDQQLYFLATLAHELSVEARGCYDFESDGVLKPRRLRMFNEIQHQVSSHIRSLLVQSNKRYPDEILLISVLGDGSTPESADEAELNAATRHAFLRAMEFVERLGSDILKYPQTPKRIGA